MLYSLGRDHGITVVASLIFALPFFLDVVDNRGFWSQLGKLLLRLGLTAVVNVPDNTPSLFGPGSDQQLSARLCCFVVCSLRSAGAGCNDTCATDAAGESAFHIAFDLGN